MKYKTCALLDYSLSVTIQESQHEVACHAQLHDSSVAQLVRAPH